MPDMTWRLVPTVATEEIKQAAHNSMIIERSPLWDTGFAAMWQRAVTASPDPAEDEGLVEMVARGLRELQAGYEVSKLGKESLDLMWHSEIIARAVIRL